jgi:DNA-3-methyladenine glycosylase II
VVSRPEIQVLTEAELPALCAELASRDDRLRHVIDECGYPPFWSRPNTFESLVWFILEQQVSLASARAALDKLRERIGSVTPENVLSLSDGELRAASFSRQKTTYVRGLAQRIVDGDLVLADLETRPDEEVRERLVRLKGVGNWTVDVYLILALHRRDLFPAGDLAAVNGLRELSGLPRATPAGDLALGVRHWAPYRTAGTMLVWHYYLSRKRPPRGAG